MKIARLLAAVALLVTAMGAHAQEPAAYPSRAVTIVVPFSAGGATDLSARMIATLLSRQLGQPFVVENRAGAGGMIGMGAVARAQADGYTLGWGGNSPMSVTPHLTRSPPYDPRTAFAPVSLAAISSWTLTSRPDLAAKDFEGLVKLAKASPGKVSIASSGNGSAPHLLAEMLKQSAGIDLLHVPYKGEIDGVNAQLGRQVDLMFTSTSAATPQLKAGKLKGYAVTTPKRESALPDYPTMAELGKPELTFEIFFGLVAPAGTPKAVVDRLAAAMKTAVADANYRDTMAKAGVSATGSSPEEFAALLKRHNERWLDVIKRNNISIE
ncbi:tripartite tricarboxylate transporter substrate binding protein [Xenophilus arseniciresistens]|uniref:Tripartite tricarboxylate transporter substrate binding protein n=1 Tax=Xenophilus arseniciresistens TaxID=1283306 RepID=A0AAE3NCE3_9BURK|nr:tripartite tricarboxylate transporter substrate binding protein [Xenophilus arseniciresistens]MDA7418998.1 tripartite tricarboxylate transporter substrate binding protein [Xenophilus arseniciresistens]